MSRALICDKCGKVIPEKGSRRLTMRWVDEPSASYIKSREDVDAYDLCTCCAGDMEVWMSSPKDEA